MYQEQGYKNPFVGYEYKEIVASSDKVSMLVDCYENFGWDIDENLPYENSYNHTKVKLKRNRKIINKMELTRLQRNFEACLDEIRSLEQSKTRTATTLSLCIGVIGTAFLAGAVFAVVHVPPIIWLCVLLSIPGFIGWIIPYFVYQKIHKDQVRKLQPLIEEKYEEIYRICEKGHSLL